MSKPKTQNHAGELVRFPGPYARLKKKLGPRMVPCEVSSRWLEFEELPAGSSAEYRFVYVMTMDQQDTPRKLCTLCVRQDDLAAAILLIKGQ